ncbi:MAG TPA: DNA mismatch repair endonuclease MutL [bacterium]|nr:DNA mismatch repair endonuclease MutL [bacterium]
MSTIKLLPEQLINQIAAGEVVERPASVVKELVENSIDAGATRIVVETAKGGREFIRVADDGRGMGREDVFMALERHATSKLSDAAGLTHIATMGFRGEALPSIASVSQFTLSSALAHGDGFKIRAKGGTIVENAPVSRPKGTEVTVGQLFFNLPARRKFLKSEEREFAYIKELVQRFATVNPAVAFELIHDGRTVLNLAPAAGALDRVIALWKAMREEVAAVTVEAAGMRGELILGSPYRTFPGPSTVAVNGRIVSDRRVNAVIFRILRESLGGDHRAAYFLSLRLPCEEVDVNVHPAKTEVRFRNEPALYALTESLLLKGLSAIRGEEGPGRIPPLPAAPAGAYGRPGGVTAGQVHEKPLQYAMFQPSAPTTPPADAATEGGFSPAVRFTGYRVIGTLFDAYVAVEMGDALYLIDQHASHERIVYSRLRGAMEHKSGLIQMTILPEPVHLSPAEMALWRERQDLFSELGFLIEPLDESTVVIRGVPALAIEPSWPSLIREMLAGILDLGAATAWDEKFLSLVAMRACKTAVRAERALAPEEIEWLITDINASETLTCPHGRPFFFVIRRAELDRKVGR